MTEEEKRENRKGIFFGVIGVLTLIVAIIGASFAYFSINVKSNENAVTVQSATVQIVYTDGQKLAVTDIIPSTKEIALKSINRATEDSGYTQCVDDNNYTICGVYEFELTNQSDNTMNINGTITPTALTEDEKGFTNLKFNLYDVTGGVPTLIYEDGSVSYSEFGIFGADKATTTELPGSTTKKYRLVVWLNEAGEANDAEQGAIFKGTVNVGVVGASGGITGVVGD